jgi:tRNA threonylcarbamoyladenosine modification (KEOPS) complex  Pcc1 subunit
VTLSSRLTIDVGDSEVASRLCRALLPEIQSNRSRAATISMEINGPCIVILIVSSTIAATRALLNSYIRWISISLDIVCMKGA